MSSLLVPWLNELLLLLSPSLLLTLTGNPKRLWFPELPGDLVLPLSGPSHSPLASWAEDPGWGQGHFSRSRAPLWVQLCFRGYIGVGLRLAGFVVS